MYITNMINIINRNNTVKNNLREIYCRHMDIKIKKKKKDKL